MSTDTLHFEATSDGLRVRLRVQPGARRDTVEGPVPLSDGRTALAVRVSAPPEGGKANTALVKLLAKTWKLPKAAITIVAGHGRRQKSLLIAGDPVDLETKLGNWFAQQV